MDIIVFTNTKYNYNQTYRDEDNNLNKNTRKFENT